MGESRTSWLIKLALNKREKVKDGGKNFEAFPHTEWYCVSRNGFKIYSCLLKGNLHGNSVAYIWNYGCNNSSYILCFERTMLRGALGNRHLKQFGAPKIVQIAVWNWTQLLNPRMKSSRFPLKNWKCWRRRDHLSSQKTSTYSLTATGSIFFPKLRRGNMSTRV